jgi:hypothetical protein
MTRCLRAVNAALLLLAVYLACAEFAGRGDAMLIKDDRAEVAIEKTDTALVVTLDGELFTRYVFADAPKPYCWPLIGPTGAPVTRAYPMEQVEGEKRDHPHQRSFWFTHGLVNGVDFWSESPAAGRQEHRAFDRIETGHHLGIIRSSNDWLAPNGKRLCQDTRELRFYGTTGNRIIDFDIAVHASDGPLTFGDTKEGMFGMRVASSMDVEQKDKKEGGHIVNSRGEVDDKAWGRPAEWVDYSGLVDGKRVGITIMNHPASFRHPTHWHVRTYGLFAANPFGLHDFYNDKSKDGSYTVSQGESIAFRYRILLHEGGAETLNLAEAYAAYVVTSPH